MPVYCFRIRDTDEPHQEFMAVAQLDKLKRDGNFIRLPDGRWAYMDFAAQQLGTAHCPGNWPMTSDALAVAPEERVDAMQDAAARGVPTEFNAEGQPVLTSAKHRRTFCEAYGYYDRNGGYSDPQPKYLTSQPLTAKRRREQNVERARQRIVRCREAIERCRRG